MSRDRLPTKDAVKRRLTTKDKYDCLFRELLLSIHKAPTYIAHLEFRSMKCWKQVYNLFSQTADYRNTHSSVAEFFSHICVSVKCTLHLQEEGITNTLRSVFALSNITKSFVR